MNKLHIVAAALGLAASPVFAGQALAKNYDVKMLDRGTMGAMAFEPAYIQVAPGDTVTFKPVDTGHNAETIPTMLPAGAQPFKGGLSQPVTVKFTKPGLYGYKCSPHFPLGMVGLVQVGAKVDKAPSVAAGAKLPGLARIRMNKLLDQVR